MASRPQLCQGLHEVDQVTRFLDWLEAHPHLERVWAAFILITSPAIITYELWSKHKEDIYKEWTTILHFIITGEQS